MMGKDGETLKEQWPAEAGMHHERKTTKWYRKGEINAQRVIHMRT